MCDDIGVVLLPDNFDNQGKSTAMFNITGVFDVKVVDVVDADTVHYVQEHAGSMQKFVGRMYGYDTAPCKTQLQNDVEYTARAAVGRAFAARARNHLAALVLGRVLRMRSMGFDRYNNVLIVLYVHNECDPRECMNVNLDMIEKKYGQAGVFGRKQPR